MKLIAVAMTTLIMALPTVHNAGRQLQCEPQTIRAGQSVTIRMPVVHGGELGVWTPDRKFFFIAFATDQGIAAPIGKNEFKKMRTLKLDTGSAVGLPSISKDAAPEKIFGASGKYQFVVSENLETEDETGANLVCSVWFTR